MRLLDILFMILLTLSIGVLIFINSNSILWELVFVLSFVYFAFRESSFYDRK